MRHARALTLLVLVHTTACAAPDAATAPTATLARVELARAAKSAGTTRVSVQITVDAPGGAILLQGLEALYHSSRNNEWLNLASRQPAGVAIEGAGRVQYNLRSGGVNADGMLVALLPSGEELVIDLAQLDQLRRSPFVAIGPGGGCIAGIIGVLRSPQHPGGVNVPVRIDFFALQD